MAHATANADGDAEQSPNELGDGLNDVREAVTGILEQIDSDSDQIEKAVGRAFIGQADREAASELRKNLAGVVGEFHDNHSITLDEVLIALWVELVRASEMATQDSTGDDEAEAEPDQAGGPGTDESQEGSEGLGELFDENNSEEGAEDETSEKTADPAFQ